MMIEKAILKPNGDLPPAKLEWDSEKEDFVIDVPNGITRADLVDLVEEVKRLTDWAE